MGGSLGGLVAVLTLVSHSGAKQCSKMQSHVNKQLMASQVPSQAAGTEQKRVYGNLQHKKALRLHSPVSGYMPVIGNYCSDCLLRVNQPQEPIGPFSMYLQSRGYSL